MANQIDPQTGATVRAKMQHAGVSQYNLAEHLDLSQAAISRRLSGDVEFTIGELTATAELLGLPLTELLPIPTLDDLTAAAAERNAP